jgi:pyridoxal biosynthesis lyase PdxS
MMEQMRWHHARCVTHLVRLRMLARDLAGVPVMSGVIQEIVTATSAILAEAEAGYCAVLIPAAEADLRTSGMLWRCSRAK